MNKIVFTDNGFWEYKRFELEERDDGVWYNDLEIDREFKVNGCLVSLLKEGKKRGYFFKVKEEYYFDLEREDEIMDWLEER